MFRRAFTVATPAIHRLSTPAFSVQRLAASPVSSVFSRSYATDALSLNKVQERVLKVVTGFEKVEAAKVTLDAHFVNDLGLDSLDQVDLTMAIEEEFSIEIPDAEADGIMTARQAADKRYQSMTSEEKASSPKDAAELGSTGLVAGPQATALEAALSNEDPKKASPAEETTTTTIPSEITPASQPKPQKSWRESKNFITVVVFLGVFVDLCIYAIVIPFVPVLVSEFGGSGTDVGVLLAVYGAGIIIFSPIMGIISDRWQNRRWPMILSLIFLFGSTVAFALAKGYWALMVARFLQGAASTGVWVLGLALIADTFHDDEAGLGKAMGYVLSGYTLGQLVGPPIGGALFQWNRYSPYVLCGVLILVDLVGRLLVIDPVKIDKNESADIDKTPAKPIGFWTLFKLCPSVLFLTFSTSMVFTGFEPTLPLHLEKQFDFSTAKVGLTFLALIIPSVIAGPVAGLAYDKYGARWVLIPSLFASAILLFPLSLGANLPWLVIGLFIVGLTFTFGLAPLLPEIANSVPREAYAKAYSLFNMAFSCGILIGPYLAAFFFEKYGWFWEMIALGCFMMLSAIFSLFYKENPAHKSGQAAPTA
ncbi:hypothetical protein HDU67_005934 [Dinochytrium kinnereticum]|nr:hypothetical protein HDU67_005934 [Dinochytrium kinnereticum]